MQLAVLTRAQKRDFEWASMLHCSLEWKDGERFYMWMGRPEAWPVCFFYCAWQFSHARARTTCSPPSCACALLAYKRSSGVSSASLPRRCAGYSRSSTSTLAHHVIILCSSTFFFFFCLPVKRNRTATACRNILTVVRIVYYYEAVRGIMEHFI